MGYMQSCNNNDAKPIMQQGRMARDNGADKAWNLLYVYLSRKVPINENSVYVCLSVMG